MSIRRLFIIVTSALVIVALAAPAEAVTATKVHVTRTSRWRRPSPDPTGVTYLPRLKRLVIVDSEVDEIPRLWHGVNVWFTTLRGRPRRAWSTLAFSHEPTDVRMRGRNTFWFTDDRAHKVVRLGWGRDKSWGTKDDRSSSFSTSPFGARDTESLAFAQVRKRHPLLLIADGKDSEVYRIAPGRNRRFDGVPPNGDDVVKASFDTEALGVPNPKGLFWNGKEKLLYVIGFNGALIARTTITGSLVDTIDTSGLGFQHPSSLWMAPASRGKGRHLYVTDKGLDNDVRPRENDGRLFELKLSP